MALGQTSSSAPKLAPINPGNLIGQADAVVEPRATAILADAFRQGVVSADDIMNRVGAVGQTRRKAELQGLQEQTSPEAVALRQQQQSTAMEQAQLGQAQAERAQVLQQFPAVAYFDKLAPAAGITEPKLPDGTPDYKQMEVIGAELAVDQAKRVQAQSELDNIVTKDTNDGTVISAFTKQGTPVPREHVAKLRSIATKPFARQTPGSVEVSPATQPTAMPVVEVAAGPLEDITVVRTRLANKFGPEVVAGMDEENLRQLDAGEKDSAVVPVVEPRQSAVAPGAAIPMGTPVAGGFSLGNTPKAPPAPKISTAEQDKANLALSRFAESKNIQDALLAKNYDPTSYGSALNSVLPQILKSGDQKMFETAKQAWAQGILRLESGAAISPAEQKWYGQTFFPTVGDTPEVVNAKAGLRSSVERTMAEIAQKGGVVSPEAVRNAALLAQPRTGTPGGGAQATSAAPVISTSTGRKVTRDKNGNYIYVE